MAFDKSQSKLYVIRKLLLQNKTYYLKNIVFFKNGSSDKFMSQISKQFVLHFKYSFADTHTHTHTQPFNGP